MAANKIPIHFWQVMYPKDIEEGTLRLSPEFVAEYGDLLSDEVMLEVSDGIVWKIRLAKELGFRQQRIWLKSGFPRFLDYYAIEVRFLLLFKFIGSSRFRAFIFDLTACEIVYPISSSSSGTRPPEPQHSMDLDMDGSDSDSNSDFNFDDPVSASSAGKIGGGASSSRPPQNVVDLTSLDSDSDSSDSDYDVRASRSKGKQPVRSGKKPLPKKQRPPPMTAGASYAVAADLWKRVKQSRIFQSREFHCMLRKFSEATLRAVGRAIDRNPVNPSFLVVIREHHLRYGTAQLPVKITAVHRMRADLPFIKLCVLDKQGRIVDEERRVTLYLRKENRRKCISKWKAFCMDNMLVEGDVCLFELFDRETNLFYIRLFRACDG